MLSQITDNAHPCDSAEALICTTFIAEFRFRIRTILAFFDAGLCTT